MVTETVVENVTVSGLEADALVSLVQRALGRQVDAVADTRLRLAGATASPQRVRPHANFLRAAAGAAYASVSRRNAAEWLFS